MYLYTGADPVNNTDPTGQCPICIGALAGGLISGAISYVESGGDLGATLRGFGSGALMGAAFGALGPVAVRGVTMVGRSVFGGTRITTTTTRTVHRLEPIVVKGARTKKLEPIRNADGPHTTWKVDPRTREITRHETWTPNARNPSGWDKVQSTDLKGAPHINKKTGEAIPTHHTQGKRVPGGVRPAYRDEIPGSGAR